MNFYPPPRKPTLRRRIGLLWTDLPAPVRMGAVLVALVLIAFLVGCATPAEMTDLQYQAYILGQREALGPDAFDSHGCKKGAS